MKKIKNTIRKKNKLTFGIKKKFKLINIGFINKNLNTYDINYKYLIQFNKLGYILSKKFNLLNLYYMKNIIALKK